MTPHSPHHRVSHAPGTFLRRSTVVLAAVVAIGGAPFVVEALGEEPLASPLRTGDAATIELSGDDVLRVPVAPEPLPELVDEAELLTPPVESLPPETPASDAPAPEPVPAEPAPTASAPTDLVTAPDLVVSGPVAPDAPAVLPQHLGATAELRYATALQPAQRNALDDPGFVAGTVPAPAPAPAPVPALPPGTTADAWAALRECESGGNYSITNPSGKYRGAYQFDRPTWNSVAGRHNPALVGVDPAAASPADQDAMAYALYSERGPQPWPHCGRHLR